MHGMTWTFLLLVHFLVGYGWAASFPHPDTESEHCRTRTQRLCDPDGILSQHELDAVEDTLVRLQSTFLEMEGEDRYRAKRLDMEKDKESSPGIEVQFAVALTQKMDPSAFENVDPSEAAEIMARGIHNDWGVGMVTASGHGTGVLVFVSQLDRALYVSKGTALDNLLTNRRLDKTIEHMKPLLRQQKYGAAVILALEELNSYIEQGAPSFGEKTSAFFEEYGIFAFVSTFILSALYWKKREARRYAEVESHLEELDRQRALALQGQFRATSCPICLEPFPMETSRNENQTASTADTREASSDSPTDESVQNEKEQESTETSTSSPSIGSDGLPLKLLVCGHVFDETCWNHWVRTGQGQVNKCPICKVDVAGHRATPEAGDGTLSRRANVVQSSMNESSNQPERNDSGGSYERSIGHNDASHETTTDTYVGNPSQRALRQYQAERAFRLMRLGARYPQYVRPHQIRQWTQTTYDGSLARDPSFVRSNPERPLDSSSTSRGHAGSSGGSSSFGISGFGGGSSGGGRSGRW